LARALWEQFVHSTVWTVRVSVFEATLGELFLSLFLDDKEQIIHIDVKIMTTIIVVMTSFSIVVFQFEYTCVI